MRRHRLSFFPGIGYTARQLPVRALRRLTALRECPHTMDVGALVLNPTRTEIDV
jgi:hypothetical protein